jgi:hypothetical protein
MGQPLSDIAPSIAGYYPMPEIARGNFRAWFLPAAPGP